MTYTTPIQFEVTSPTHLDAKIAEIQTALKTANLSWNQYSFARAYRFAKNVEGAKVYYPAVYQATTKDYLNVFPNDNLTAYSFVYVKQPQELESETNQWQDYTADIAIILAFRLDKIGTSYDYRFTERLKYDVVEALKNVDKLDIGSVYDEMEECFDLFTVSEIETEYLSEKWGALRLDCSVGYGNNCLIENSY